MSLKQLRFAQNIFFYNFLSIIPSSVVQHLKFKPLWNKLERLSIVETCSASGQNEQIILGISAMHISLVILNTLAY
jgi:hypothetical protein